MALRKKTASTGLKVWTVAEFGDFYTEHRRELVAHASRILKDSARSEEVIQDALIKVMLAAPELESTDHALGYMHRTIENLCMDIFRSEGRRPNLVVLDEVTAELESQWADREDLSDVISAAEDAGIVRQALSLLSPAERAALVMWEIEGRSTAEIASELGIKESAVRHTVSRARASFRKVLSEVVIDEERGLTALDLLSKSYRKSVEMARKSSKVALSIILALFALIGFNSFPSSKHTNVSSSAGSSLKPSSKVMESVQKSNHAKNVSLSEIDSTPTSVKKTTSPGSYIKSSELKFPGLDKDGVPLGFTVSDSSGMLGSLYVGNRSTAVTETDITVTSVIKTASMAANIFMTQSLTTDANGLTYSPVVAYGSSGTWAPLVTRVSSSSSTRMTNGNYLFTAMVAVESAVDSPIKVAASAGGRDLVVAPRQIITRLVLDPTKTQVLSQAVYVVEKGAR